MNISLTYGQMPDRLLKTVLIGGVVKKVLIGCAERAEFAEIEISRNSPNNRSCLLLQIDSDCCLLTPIDAVLCIILLSFGVFSSGHFTQNSRCLELRKSTYVDC